MFHLILLCMVFKNNARFYSMDLKCNRKINVKEIREDSLEVAYRSDSAD
jgi:hypothetical protein